MNWTNIGIVIAQALAIEDYKRRVRAALDYDLSDLPSDADRVCDSRIYQANMRAFKLLVAVDAYHKEREAVSVTIDCTEACERVAICTVCGQRKPPIGRDVAVAAAGSYCEHECPGHFQDPQSGHLWPGELRRGRGQEL